MEFEEMDIFEKADLLNSMVERNESQEQFDVNDIPEQLVNTIIFNRYFTLLVEQNQKYGYHINSIFDEYIEENFDEFFLEISRILELDNQMKFLVMNLIEKFIEKNENEFILDETNQYRFVTAAMILIKKIYDDTNSNFKSIYNMIEHNTPFSTYVLRDIEISFLNGMEYSLFLNDKEFAEYKFNIITNWLNIIKLERDRVNY